MKLIKGVRLLAEYKFRIMVYSCEQCGKSYTSHYNLKRHTANLHSDLREEGTIEVRRSAPESSAEEMSKGDEELSNTEDEQPLAPF